MLTLTNLTSYIPPVPVAPTFPDFALCHSAYGAGMKKQNGIFAAGILPRGTEPVTYTVMPDESSGRATLFELPFAVSFAEVVITVEVAGPVNIDNMLLIPNDIRGMAAYLANSCVGRGGTGGFVTKRIQGLLDFVTDPMCELDSMLYPPSTAFLTLTMSTPAQAHTFPGDCDPAMALCLERAESRALSIVEPHFHLDIAGRMIRFAVQATRMQRLGIVAWWDDPQLEANTTGISREILDGQLANMTAEQIGTSRRRKRVRAS